MDKLITFLRTELPEDALEIQASIELLNQCISSSVGNLKSAVTNAFDQRDYKKMAQCQEIVKEIDEIQDKLEEYSKMLQLDDDVKDSIIEEEEEAAIDEDNEQIPDYDSLKVDQNKPHTLYESYTYKRPAGFEILGERFDVKEWKDVLVKTCSFLASRDQKRFNNFVDDKTMQGRKHPYFCKDPEKTPEPRKVEGTDIYVMSNMSANQIRNMIIKMLRRYNIKISDYNLYFKADYTARHK